MTNLARSIHGEFAEHLKHAPAWAMRPLTPSGVRGDHLLADGDVVELRT